MSPNARLEPQDLYLFNEGTHDRLYAKLGAHNRDQAVQLLRA